MKSTQLRILIVGGYGVFGGRLGQLLADEKSVELVIAGRSKERAQAFCNNLHAEAALVASHFDRGGDIRTQIEEISPDIIVDASGPFQGYSLDPYSLVRVALDLGIDYMDLADSSDFVEGIVQFDSEAKKQGIFLLSGVSSFPVLTASVVRNLAQGLERLDSVVGGIAPSPFAGVGPNVIRAIASYAGKQVSLIRDGKPSFGNGLAESIRFTICPPGRLPLRNILFSLVDVPDLRVLPKHWPELQSIWMGAGTVPESLHIGLKLLAFAVRLRMLPSLSFLAPFLHWAINVLRWGEHRGGMFVRVDGTTQRGTQITRSWHLLAEGNDGPLIPSMAIEAIVRNCLKSQRPMSGARPATQELELSDYEELFCRRTIFTGTRQLSGDQHKHPLYKRILGSAWEKLPTQVQDMHNIESILTADGLAEVERGRNFASRAIGYCFGFPEKGRNIPVTLELARQNQGEVWKRRFGKHSFSSDQSEGNGRSDMLLEERFGVFSFGLALVVSQERLSFVVRRWSCLGVPLPMALAPFGDSYEHVVDGRFHFNVEISLPLVGLIVCYKGSLEPNQANH